MKHNSLDLLLLWYKNSLSFQNCLRETNLMITNVMLQPNFKHGTDYLNGINPHMIIQPSDSYKIVYLEVGLSGDWYKTWFHQALDNNNNKKQYKYIIKSVTCNEI